MSISTRRLQAASSNNKGTRESLVPGTYVPGATTTGPLPGTTFFDVEDNGSGVIALNSAWLSARGVTLDGDDRYTLTGLRFWGEVRFNTPKIRLRNCQIHGPDPTVSTSTAIIKNYGAGYYHATLENCLIDPLPWYTERGRAMMTDVNYQRRCGISGGDLEVRWTEIRNVEDGWALIQNDDLVSDPGNPRPDGQRFWVCDRNWIHACTYVNGPDYMLTANPGSGGSPHADAFQFNTGRNGHLVGCMLGGSRNPLAYDSWPTTWERITDDYSNAAIMLQQEVSGFSVGDPRWIDATIIEDNFLGGGNATINVVYKNSNTLEGVTIRRNKWLQRGANWGVWWQDAAQMNSYAGFGQYIAKGGSPTSALALSWSDNTVLETGTTLNFVNT